MTQILAFAMFFVTLIGTALLLHWYMWRRYVVAPRWPSPWSRRGTWVFVALAAILPAGMPLIRSLPREVAAPFAWVVYVWMGLGFLLVVMAALSDLVQLAMRGLEVLRARRDAPPDPERRIVLARGAAGAAAVAGVGLGGMALRGGLGEVEVVEVPVRLERLPRQLDGMTIVQLTDIHVGPTIGKRFVDQVVSKVNELKADAVVITGDLVDGSVAALGRDVEALGQLRARWGNYFCLGNHEYYSGAEPWIAELERIGIRVLRNERVALGDARASIDLAGVDDFKAGRFGHQPDLAKAVAGRDPDRELVVLAHQPAEIDNAARLGAGLQISGHTHGGQLWPFTELVKFAHPYVAGLHRHGEHTQIYVSQGTGYWGPPMRLAAPAEITKIVLVKA